MSVCLLLLSLDGLDMCSLHPVVLVVIAVGSQEPWFHGTYFPTSIHFTVYLRWMTFSLPLMSNGTGISPPPKKSSLYTTFLHFACHLMQSRKTGMETPILWAICFPLINSWGFSLHLIGSDWVNSEPLLKDTPLRLRSFSGYITLPHWNVTLCLDTLTIYCELRQVTSGL